MSSEHFSSEESGRSRVWKECSMIMNGKSTSAEGIDYEVEVVAVAGGTGPGTAQPNKP